MNFNDSSDFDDEPKEINSLLKTALTFTPEYDPRSYDPATAVPTSGDDFLQYVMYESSRCEQVVTANLNNLKLKKIKINGIINNEEQEESSFHTLQRFIPSLEWQNDQINLFSKLRDRLEYLRTNNSDQAMSQNKHKNVEWSVSNCEKQSPSLAEAVCIRQPKVINFLYDLITIVDKLPVDVSSLPHHIGVWLYTSLALLYTPLLPNTCSALRQLARKCIQLRSKLSVEDEHVVEKLEPLNLFICLVGRYFNQIDLADKVS